jgi:hypothetical protein
MSYTKTVFSYDPVSRAYMRAIHLDESDLSPADLAAGNLVWLIPGNCLESEPPAPPVGKYAAEENGGWVLRDIPKVEVPEGSNPPSPPPPAEITLEMKIKALQSVVESYLDATAQNFNYDNINTAVSYAEEKSVPKFWAEGRMLRKLRSLTYAKCYAILAQFQAGEIEEPTVETLYPMLPVPDMITCAAEQAALEAEQAAEEAARLAPPPADAEPASEPEPATDAEPDEDSGA